VSAFHKIIADVRSALERGSRSSAERTEPAADVVPIAEGACRAEFISQFARELEALGGHFLGVLTPDDAKARIVALARELGVRTAAVGDGVVLDADPIARALEQDGVTLAGRGGNAASPGQRDAIRAQFARCDLSLVEAHYAIAATGTVAVVATPGRPNSLTLLPPTNVIMVHVDRVMPDLAAVVGALGPETIATHRVSLITGPSRTADIEKMIVLGVHGPKQLYATVIWPPAP